MTVGLGARTGMRPRRGKSGLLPNAARAANHQKHEPSHWRSREAVTGLGELLGGIVTVMFHIHHWSHWSPAYQPSLSLTWRRHRKCRTCGREQVELI